MDDAQRSGAEYPPAVVFVPEAAFLSLGNYFHLNNVTWLSMGQKIRWRKRPTGTLYANAYSSSCNKWGVRGPKEAALYYARLD